MCLVQYECTIKYLLNKSECEVPGVYCLCFKTLRASQHVAGLTVVSHSAQTATDGRHVDPIGYNELIQ